MLSRFTNLLKPTWIVWLMIAAYIIFFSANSLRIHAALQTHTSDLGQIDLAVWNTSRARFLQEMKGTTLSTRLTDHVEPIWIPISTIYWLWDDVRALLLLQTVALAVGAWPLYLLARRRLLRREQDRLDRNWQLEQHQDRLRGIARRPTAPPSALTGWGPVMLVAIYLLNPSLQAANLTEVHAIPFAVPFILFAFWFIDSGRWWAFFATALVLAAVKEEAALLSAVLGAYAFLRILISSRQERARSDNWRLGLALSVAVTVLSVLWFALATFVIIPLYAERAYGVAESTYFQRYGTLGNSAGDILRAVFSQPADVWQAATTPGRVRYLVGLILSTGGLALFGPEIILLSAPILLANVLSTFEAQWSGELHYTAPLVPYFMVAAAIGLERLGRWLGRQSELSPVRLANRLGAAALLIAFVYHLGAGWSPVGRNFRWPPLTDHARLLPEIIAQIPDHVPLAATTALVPHFAHRQFIYTLPNLGKAEWVVADVSGTTDMHASALQSMIGDLMQQGWGVVDALDGYIILSKQGGATTIRPAFYDFARVASDQALKLDQEVVAEWSGGTTYLGYQLEDQPQWGLTRITHYVRVGDVPLSPYFALYAVDGSLADDVILRPPPALQWYGPDRWQKDEVLAFSSAWFLPGIWRPMVAFASVDDTVAPAQDSSARIPPIAVTSQQSWEIQESALWLQPWQRPSPGDDLRVLAGDPSDGGKGVQGAGSVTVWMQTPPHAPKPGEEITFRLGWLPTQDFSKDYTVFVHLLDEGGRRVAQADDAPHHFYPVPTSFWQGGQAMLTGHTITIPPDLPPGTYQLSVGLYDPVTSTRLSVASESTVGMDAAEVGTVRVRRGDGDTHGLGS